MRLFLVQHGEAVAKDIDPDRPLSEHGEADIARLAAWLAERGARVSRVVHSGKTRARQTAEILAAAVAPELSAQVMAGLAPRDPVEPVLAEIDNWQDDTVLVGHQPFMGRLVAALLQLGDRGVVAFRPGTLVCLESDGSKERLLVTVLRPESYRP